MMIGLSAGLLASVPAVVLAVASAGAGHGQYSLARVLYPYTMLLTRLAGDSITPPLVALALAQFPLYGAAIGLTSSRKRLLGTVVGAISTFHVIACCACFGGAIPNFS
jgi:hypothetical protein